MPLTVPMLDDRRFQDLLDEALARAAAHNPEWTNFQPSDPGVTILESFAFLVETLLYRANRIPERDRAKFLTLLRIPLAPARAARAVVVFTKKDGSPVTLGAGTNLTAGPQPVAGAGATTGPVPFFTESALDVLPGEARAVVKRLAALDEDREAEYDRIYKTLKDANPGSDLVYYEPAPLPAGGIDLSDTADRAVWLALLAPEKADPVATRAEWSGKTLGLGLAPRLAEGAGRTLFAGGASARVSAQSGGWTVELAYLDPGDRDRPGFRTLRTITIGELKDEPAAYEVPLPAGFGAIGPPEPRDAFDQGSGAFPPELDPKDKGRVAAWLRLTPTGAAFTSVLWAGVGAVAVRQSRAVRGEVVGTGTGEPDQEFALAQAPVVPGTVRVRVRRGAAPDAPWDEWAEIDDLLAAGPQTVAGAPDADPTRPSRVFQTDAEAGVIRFGDGLRGARPGLGLPVRADYEVSAGRGGNVGAGQIKAGGDVPDGIDATNPLPARGGGDAQSAADAEKLIPQAVRHRDRLVTLDDYRDLVLSAPGAGVGRVEVLPLYAPVLGASLPGDVAGAVTLLLVPADDPARPDAPSPTPAFLDAICAHLEPKRQVTAEVYLQGPEYVGLTVSAGFELQPGYAAADVRERVAAALRAFLSPLPADAPDANNPVGWPLEKPVNARELLAVVSKAPGVRSAADVLLAGGSSAAAVPEIKLTGLQLPRIDRLSVTVGPPVALASLVGGPGGSAPGTGRKSFPVPVIPREC